MNRRIQIILIALIAVIVPLGRSQNVSATLRGTVRDGAGAVITGAEVLVLNNGTGATHKTTTNNTGDYVVVQLSPAAYTVTVTAKGFEPSSFTNIVLNVDQEARVDATLRVGTVAQQVVVNSTAILLQTEDSVNGSVIDSQKLEELPSNSRNFWQEAQLDPNVSPTATGDSLANRGGFIVAGITSANNNYLLDGSDDNDWTTGQPTVRPSEDAIQEFRIITGEAPAEYGSKNGGQVVLTSRSGTNDLHGGSFISYRDGKWNAPQYNFTGGPAVAPAGTTKLFGGSFGGPFRKDKTFFFATYEGTRLTADPAVSGQTPFDAWKGGSYSSDGNAQFTSKIIDPTTGKPFAQNAAGLYEIPENRISSATQLLLKYFPEATSQTGTVGEFANHLPNTQNENQGTFRVDQVLTHKDSLNGIYTILDGQDAGTIGDLVVSNGVVPGFGGIGPHIYQHASISEQHTFSATLFNEVRIGFNRMDAGYYNQDAGAGNVVAALGLPQGGNFMEPATDGNTGVPSISIAGLSSIGTAGNPQWRGDNTVQLSDGLTWVIKNHTTKFGFDALDFFKHSFYVNPDGRGLFTFNGQYTGGKGNLQNEFADFLLGDIYSDAYSSGNENQYPIQHSGALFAQDEWKVTSSLTLNYGLRWDYLGPVREAYNLINSFDLIDNQIFTGQGQIYDLNNSTGLLQLTGTRGTYRNNYAAIYSLFAPRAGFAYRVHGRDDTVIRGGFGTYYGIPSIQTWNSANGLGAPFVLSKSFTGPTPSKATGITTNPYQLGPTAFGATGTQTTNAIAITTENSHIRSLYTEQYSFGVQHEFGKAALVEASYQGSRTFHNVSSQNLNIPTLATRLANPSASTSVNALRPYNTIGTDSQWAGISLLSDGYYSNYNSLLLRAERRFENGLNFQSYLVYAKSLEVSSLQNPYDFASNYGPSAWDQKFRSVTNGVYSLPIGHGQHWLNSGPSAIDYVLGGWQASTVVTFQSGRPVNTSTTDSLASYTGASDRAFAVAGVSATAKVDGNTGLGTHTPQNWFNTAAYRSNDPGNGTNYTSDAASGYVYNYGTAGFDSVRGPGLQDVDFGLIKHVRVNDRNQVEFRADAFNILNHPNFTNPSAAYGGATGTGITPGTTAVITSTVNSSVPTATGGPRQLQLALRYSF